MDNTLYDMLDLLLFSKEKLSQNSAAECEKYTPQCNSW